MKRLLILSLLAFGLLATTFTFAKDNTSKENGDNRGMKNYLSSYNLPRNRGSGTVLTPDQILCMKNAVEKRETSMITYTTTFQTAILSALNTRKTDLLAARSLTTKEEIKASIKKARTTFKSSKKLAKEDLRKGEKSAWKTFKTEAKTCKLPNGISELEKDNEGIKTIE